MTTPDPAVAFLLEEYKNIAATHDKLRDMLARLFNYFLLLSAFPFTVAGVMFQQGEFDLLAAPLGLHLLFLVVGVGHLFLTLSLIDARLSQYRYARTVNAIRKYFVDGDARLSGYVFLPTSTDVPSWEDLGYIEYQVLFHDMGRGDLRRIRVSWDSTVRCTAVECCGGRCSAHRLHNGLQGVQDDHFAEVPETSWHQMSWALNRKDALASVDERRSGRGRAGSKRIRREALRDGGPLGRPERQQLGGGFAIVTGTRSDKGEDHRLCGKRSLEALRAKTP